MELAEKAEGDMQAVFLIFFVSLFTFASQLMLKKGLNIILQETPAGGTDLFLHAAVFHYFLGALASSTSPLHSGW